ncbi:MULTISPECIES: radical SAM protein [unclassified Streptomyces]|uniref:radical SAM protein n=1 Tax=unclassified Streptomyces TaxID=2593676 RepID=UPI0013168A09|nr:MULTISPECIES: radical SAM protein [unclassified Streptomyces]QHC31809.1 radical SAM protein [Streptomyces sp. HF10]WKE69213.1 radical SAM protein [Streptomyces sp. WP-1]
MTARIKDFEPRDVRPGDTIVVFGAGDVAQLTQHALEMMGIPVGFFCDPLLTEDSATLRGTPVLPPAALDRLDPGTTCVIDAWDHTRYARQPALLARFSRLFVAVSLLGRTAFGEAAPVLPAERPRRIAHYTAQCEPLLTGAGRLRLRSLDVVVTEACTMRCVDCSNLMQYYAHPRHSDLDELHTALDRLLAAVDGVEEFRVLGGEPFANPRAGQVVRTLTGMADTARVVVYTNGTIVPRGDLLESLVHPRMLVKITDYGELSKRHDDLCDTLTDHGVTWVSQKPVWTDSGRIGRVDRTPEELDRTFRDCCVNDLLTLLNGRLYLCPFSANAMNLGAVPDAPDDVIDLRTDWPADELRARIEALYHRHRPLTACSFCRGRDQTTPTVEPAIQVRRPLPLTVVSGPR